LLRISLPSSAQLLATSFGEEIFPRVLQPARAPPLSVLLALNFYVFFSTHRFYVTSSLFVPPIKESAIDFAPRVSTFP